MNRRIILLGTAAAAIAAFGGGSWYVRRQREAEAATVAAAALARDAEALIRPHSPILGPADAPVTLVEFFDPSCEACRAFHPVIEELRKEFPTQLRIVLRYTPFHQGSDEAVRILEAARRQDKFEHVLNALFEKQPEWATDGSPDLDRAWRIAGAVGLDLEKARADRLFPGTTAILNQDMADVEAMQIRATPTFFLDGNRLERMGLDDLRAAVSAAVARNG